MNPAKRAVVIGAGFGGLALAIRPQRAGIQTTLLEKRDKPGGRAYVYHDQGFTFDAGPTVITDPAALEELFSGAGRRMADYVELLPVSPFYRLCWEDGYSFDYVNDQAALDRQIHARNPQGVAGYQRFLEYSKAVYQAGYVELGTVPFLSIRDMVAVAPQLAKLQAWRSVYAMVSRFIKDEKLRQALSFHSLLVGGNPFETSSIYTLIHYLEREWGVYIPRGGTGALVNALLRLFEELGGTLLVGCPVRGVELTSSSSRPVHRVDSPRGPMDFDLVVSNADVHHTYARLYHREPAARRMQRRLESSRWSMSLFVLYFGTDRSYDICHHSVLFGPRYREHLQEIFHGDRLPDDFSLYLHAPSVTDRTLAPEGSATFYVLSPVPHLGNAPIDWDRAGPAYAARLFASLEQLLPNLRRHVVTWRCFTPTDFERELAAYQGSAFSVAPTLGQSAWFRPHNRDPNIPGLYLVGAGTHPGAGLPGVINSAKATVNVVLDDLRKQAAA